MSELNYSLVGFGPDGEFADIPIPSEQKQKAISIIGVKIIPGFRLHRYPVTYAQANEIVRLFQGIRCTLGRGMEWTIEGYEEDAKTHQEAVCFFRSRVNG